jgi:hypothetical protein
VNSPLVLACSEKRMPLHNWSKLPEWEGVNQLWISELYYDISGKLPAGYRAGLGTVPALTIGSPSTKPDVSVHESQHGPIADVRPATTTPFDFEPEIDVLTLDPSVVVDIYREHELVAVLELISPRNKDRASARNATRDRIVGYLMLGVHVAYVDVHPNPSDFSLADSVAQNLGIQQAALPSPHAMAYRVGPPSDKLGRSLALCRAQLAIGQALPAIALPLCREITIPVDLESTYVKVTRSYLSWLPSTNRS